MEVLTHRLAKAAKNSYLRYHALLPDLFSSAFVTLSNAQVVNSISKDKTGFYGHALDSVISIIKENKALGVVYVGGRECVKSYLPDSLQGVVLSGSLRGSRKKKN